MLEYLQVLRRVLVVAAICVLLPTSQFATSAEALRWKFTEGGTMPYAVAQHAVAAVTNSGLDFDVVSTQILDTEWSVVSVAVDGTADLEMKITRVQMRMSNPFASNFAYDSEEGKAGEGPMWPLIGPLVEATLNQPFRAKVSPAGVVSEIQLPESLATILAQQTSMAAQNLMMGGSFGASAYHEMIEWTFLRLPAEDAPNQAAWTWDYAAAMASLGTMSTHVEFQRAPATGAEGSVVPIDLRHESNFEVSDQADGAFYLEITEQDSSGTATFDRAAGRLVQGRLVQKMSLEGDVRGNEFFQDRDVTTTIAWGTSDELPEGATGQ